MDAHALRVLEFSKLKEILMTFASSSLGREAARLMEPSGSAGEVRLLQQEVTEMWRLLMSNETIPLEGLFDVREPLTRSAVLGAVLDAAEIIVIGETVTAARVIRTYLKRVSDRIQSLSHYGSQLIPHPEIEEELKNVFNEQGDIRDSATHELSRIRKSIRQQRDTIVQRLDRLIRGKYREYLQENYYTQREGRYVLPVDARYQSQVNGIVHDRSATSVTVFIEPMEIVQDGNRLKELQRDEEIEMRRILRHLTEVIAACRIDLMNNLTIFQQIDLIYAKARFSVTHGMNPPVISDGGDMRVYDAQHPLLLMRHGREKVVPCTVVMEEKTNGVIITGPNTGGKTVVLKTVGLLTLMAQCGMHVSAKAVSEFPVFRYVGADIGDEQSLEHSLSTFSSHISNIRDVLQNTDERSLVLLDELGSGTDPIEGGPLAVSILQEIVQKNAKFLVTTHLHDLKLFAYKTDNVENGALEFDMATLKPTYVFHLGLPGQSNAIQIAKQLGLPPAVIDRALAETQQRGDTPEDLLKQLGEEIRAAEKRRAEAEEELRQAQLLLDESQQRLERSKKEAREVIRRSERKAQGLLDELERRLKRMEEQHKNFEREWESKLQEIVANSKAEAPSGEVIQKLRSELNVIKRRREWIEPDEEKPEKRQKWDWSDLVARARVRVAGFTALAAVTAANRQKDWIEVSINSMTLRVPSRRVLAVYAPMDYAEAVYSSSVSVERPKEVYQEIDIHGMTVDEMTPVIEKFVDEAFRGGCPSIRIVHGHGTGRLRRAVRQMVAKNPVVNSFRNGMDYEGGTGVTVVDFVR